MAYELRSARYIATDCLRQIVRPGDHVITTALEHNSVLRPLSELARSGVITLTLVPPDGEGRILAADVARAITPRTRLAVMTHMSNVLGMAQDMTALGAVCARQGVLLLADCS